MNYGSVIFVLLILSKRELPAEGVIEHRSSDVVLWHGDVPGSCQLDRQWQILDKFFNFISQVHFVVVVVLVVEVHQAVVLIFCNPFISKRSSAALAPDIHVSCLTDEVDSELVFPQSKGLLLFGYLSPKFLDVCDCLEVGPVVGEGEVYWHSIITPKRDSNFVNKQRKT